MDRRSRTRWLVLFYLFLNISRYQPTRTRDGHFADDTFLDHNFSLLYGWRVNRMF